MNMVTAAELKAKWSMTNPVVGQITGTPNSFQLTNYGVVNTELQTGTNTKVTFYSKDCKYDGIAVNTPQYNVPGNYFTGLEGSLDYVRFEVKPGGAEVSFQFDPQQLSSDDELYGVVDDAYITDRAAEITADEQLYPGSGVSYDTYENYKGFGALRICVRSSIGYGGILNIGYNGEDFEGDTAFQEVNFIESLITVVYDFENSFELVAFNVEPKQKEEVIVEKENYQLVAWLCDKTSTKTDVYDYKQFLGAEDHVYPVVYAQGESGNSEYFNQGALITACVRPSVDAWKDGLRMDYISEFNWTRDDLSQTASGLNIDSIEQVAIEKQVDITGVTTGGTAAGNLLTSYSGCYAAYCDFSSILFADFYVTRGVVSGVGKATLRFPNRRLGAPEDEYIRQLQEDGDASSFDISVSVDAVDEGPGAIKTAGGASFRITTLASFIALLSVSLLG